MSTRNQHGLTRTIPSCLKREIRQRCGFGCVRCGHAFFDYEHFAPDFKDAAEHRAEGITLLCMQCNQKRNRGVLSAETVAAANASPKCLQQGFASESFDFAAKPIEIAFAGVTIAECPVLIDVNNFPLLSIRPPEEEGEPFRLSGLFADDAGQTTLKIEDNVFSVGADNWDVECEGPRITIRSSPRNIVLVLKQEPPRRMVIERLNMQFEEVYLRGDITMLEASFDGVHWTRWQGSHIKNCAVAMAFRSR